MGTSTDAILVYGIPIAEDTIAPAGDDEETPASGPQYLLDYNVENGITITKHCSYDFPMYILSISDTVSRAYRGSPLPMRFRKTKPEWRTKLRAYAKKHKLETDGKPGWYLCSMWG